MERQALPGRPAALGRSLKQIIVWIPMLLISLGVRAAVFPVTNTGDAGPGSLRRAILDANAAGGGPHTIAFNVYGPITILSSLPAITSNGLTIDGQNRITINSNGVNQVINPFIINANNVTIRNFTLTNNGDVYFVIQPNTSGVMIQNIVTYSNNGNFLNTVLRVGGASTNLTVRNIISSDIEPCSGTSSGRGLYFTGGLQTNVVLDSIRLSSQSNSRGCEGIVFQDANINGLSITNSHVSGFQNGVVLRSSGAAYTASNVTLNQVIVDSMTNSMATGFYSNLVNKGFTIKNSVIDQRVVTSATKFGVFGIRFNNTTSGVTLDSVQVKNVDSFSIWFNGAASNININHSSVSKPVANVPASVPYQQFIRFENTASTVNIKNTTLNGYVDGTRNAGFGLVFMAPATDIVLDSLDISNFTGAGTSDGIFVGNSATNFSLNHSVFSNNFDGIEFYNNAVHKNVSIQNCSFLNGLRSGILFNTTNATQEFTLTADTIAYNTSHGIVAYGGNIATNANVTGCVIHDNGGVGVYMNSSPTNVVISKNSVYNNALAGIFMDGSGNCGYTGANRPTLGSSISLGGGQYQLQLTIPNISAGAQYSVELYANDPGDSAAGGHYYVTTLTGLSAGTSTQTINFNTGPGATGVGFWTATLRIPANSCGTSAFSAPLPISLKGPAGVNNGILAWYRADNGASGSRWSDISGNANHLATVGSPTMMNAFVNFNPAFYYNGSSGHRAPASAGVTGAYTIGGMGKLEGSQNFRVFTSTTGNKLLGWQGGLENRMYVEAWLNSGEAITNLAKLYSFKRATSPAAAFEFRGNGASLNTGGATDGGVWTLDIAERNGTEFSKVYVPEVYIYSRDITPAEMQRVESYMALKYGLTLNNGNTNYVATDGTVYWAADPTWFCRITGIGRDSVTLLYQKQSLSQDTGTVTIALGSVVTASNAANAATIGSDKSFLVFADNNGGTGYNASFAGVHASTRMARVWKIQRTSWSDQTITLQFKGAGINNYLLIGMDPAFGTASQELRLDATGSVSFNSALLPMGACFTLGADIKGPGNVNTGIAMWLRADDGTASGAQWNDHSGNSNAALQPATGNRPAVLSAPVNFNPALQFNGSSSCMNAPSMMTAYGVSNLQIYAVSVADNVQNQTLFFEPIATNAWVGSLAPWGDGNLYWDAAYSNRVSNPWGGRTGTPFLWSFLRSPGAMSSWRNRVSVASFTGALNNAVTGTNQDFVIGRNASGANPFNGKIAELIVYNNAGAITGTQRQQIESYLALKYGLTLSPAAPVDYLATDGSAYWSAATNSGYTNHITGIGRDSLTGLYQRQSRSTDTGYVTIALGSAVAAANAVNAAVIAADKSFFVFGDNGAPMAFSKTITGVTGVNIALARIWKVQKSNWADQDITLTIDSTQAIAQYLLINSNPAFGAGAIAIPVVNGTITFNSSQLGNGAYFTFGNTLQGPGGVTTGIKVWLRPDAGVTMGTGVRLWSDQSGMGNDVSQAASAAQPVYNTGGNLVNFNPTLGFNGSNQTMARSNGIFGTGAYTAANAFILAQSNAVQNQSAFFETLGTGTQFNLHLPWNTGNVIWDGAMNSRITTPWGGTLGIPYLWSGTNNNNAEALRRNGLSIVSGATAISYTGNNSAFNVGAGVGTNYYNGLIPELAIFTQTLTPTQIQQVQSYYALKYGITLDQTTAYNYLASDGTTVVWNATANSGYKNNITGIGRDSIGGLNQKQSRSINTAGSGNILTIGVGGIAASNMANPTTITNDKSFFIYSDNGGAIAYQTQLTGVTGSNVRMARVWKVQRTSWADQSITLKLAGATAQHYLIVSTDPTFSTGVTAYVFTDSTVMVNSGKLADGSYFTFGTMVKGPNCVNNGITLWLRADDGTANGAQWNDASGNGLSAVQTSGPAQPAIDARAINFNYGLTFDGASDYMDIGSNLGIAGTNPFTVITVAKRNTVGGINSLLSQQGIAANTFSHMWIASNQYALGPVQVGSVVSAGIYPKAGVPAITAATRSGNTFNFYMNGGADGSSTAAYTFLNVNTRIGNRNNTGDIPFAGPYSEAITYNRTLTAAEMQQVCSYLSLKYGLTLASGTQNYLASDGSSYWTSDPAYKRRITGIGRDDCPALNTRQSLNADTGFVTLSLGGSVAATNLQNSNTITNDKSFLVFADDGGTLAYTVPVSGANVTQRLARVWKIQKTNWADQNITLTAANPAKNMYLIVSTTSGFTTLSQELPMDAKGTITLNSSLIPNGVYFTFARKQLYPGGVTGAAFWIRGDVGTESTVNNTPIAGWNDMSLLSNNAQQNTATAQPLFMNNAASNINFNPVVKFDGASTYLTAGSVFTTSGVNNLAIFAMGTPDKSQAQAQAQSLFSELVSNGNCVNAYLPWSDGNVYWDAPVPSRVNTAWGGIFTNPYLWTFTRSTTNMAVSRNTTSIVSTNGSYPAIAGNNNPFYLGAFRNGSGVASIFTGKIGELIVYNNAATMTATDRQRIHTYLSVKYGISMDQTTATNYLATDGTTKIWDATANAVYKYSVTGIGRDDLEGLSQLQSRNSDTTRLRIVAGLGGIGSDNLTNTNTFAADKSYLLWGDDNGGTTYGTAVTGVSPAANFRMTRLWKVQVTGTVDAVQVAIPYNAVPNPAQAYLIVSNSTSLDATSSFYKLSLVTIGGVKHYAASVTFTNGQYFSFGANLKAPGGVGGASLWLRPDYGISSPDDNSPVGEWLDAASQINSATQPLAGNQPSYMNNATDNINFNPMVKFTAAGSNFMKLDVTKLPTGTSARTLIAMSRMNAPIPSSGFPNLIGWGTGATNQGSGLGDVVTGPHSGNFIGVGNDIPTAANFWKEGVFNEMFATWAGNGGNAAIYSKTKLVAGPIAKAWNTGTAAGASIGTPPWSTDFWNGGIGDVIVYPFALTAIQQQQVESYLAVKYGYTIDQTAATNYLASDGTTVTWNATANNAYKNRITGIGRDDLTALNQLQSCNQDTSNAGWAAIGLGNIAPGNLSNTNSFAADKTFLLWGDDGIAGTATSAVTGDGTTTLNPSNTCITFRRLAKTWKVAQTGIVGAVQVNVNLNGLALAKSADDLYLAINNTNAFGGTVTQLVQASSLTDNIAEFDNVSFSDGQYFTVIGQKVYAPSGIGTGMATWLKAESGVVSSGTTVQEWDDQGSINLNALQSTPANQPGYTASAINFNPALTFNGTSQRMVLDGTKLPSGNSARTVIAVTAAAATAGKGVISWGDPGTATNGMRYTMEIGGGQRSVESAGSRYGNTGGNTTIPGITTFTNAAGTTTAGTMMYANGGVIPSSQICCGSVNINTASLALAYLGDNTLNGGGSWYKGQLPEILVYNRVLTTTEQQTIESYLAIKYGITAGRDYIATGSVPTLWSVTGADAGYKNNIAGLWRIDCNDLYQKQAQSMNDPVEITIGAGTIAASNADNTALLNNESFLIWGANGTAAYTFNASYKGIGNLRLNRVWKVRDNGGVGSVQLAIPQAAIIGAGALQGACDAYKMLVSTSPADPGTAWDNTNATEYPLTVQSINGVNCFVTDIDFASNSDSYFTFTRGEGAGGTIYLVPDNAMAATGDMDKCEDNTWIYFLDPANHARRILAIKKNGNTVDKNDFAVNIDVTTDYSNPAGSPLGKAGGSGPQSAVFLMRRLADVAFTPQAGHSITTPLNVRIYWDNGSVFQDEKQKALDNLNSLIAASGITVSTGPTFQWFKAGGQDIPTTLSGFTSGGINNDANTSANWPDAADANHTYGVDGGVPYVEFSNVSSFSTFGGGWFVNKPDVSILPVHFVSFDVQKKDAGVALVWRVSNQQHCKGYAVERSVDGVTWDQIGYMPALATAPVNVYTFTDGAPQQGNNYYRIREEDMDGKRMYSEIKLVKSDNSNFTVALFPIPAHEVLNIFISTDRSEKAELKIVDMQGKVIRTEIVYLQNGTNRITSNIQQLSAGVYFLQLSGQFGKWTGKIIKN